MHCKLLISVIPLVFSVCSKVQLMHDAENRLDFTIAKKIAVPAPTPVSCSARCHSQVTCVAKSFIHRVKPVQVGGDKQISCGTTPSSDIERHREGLAR